MIRNVYGHSTGTHRAGEIAWLPAKVAIRWIAEGWAREDKSLEPKETKA